jgi:hypothetical protein
MANVVHTIRRADGSWFPFGDVEGQAGAKGIFTAAACAVAAQGSDDLQLCGINYAMGSTHVWHTLRHPDGTWQPFGDVLGQAGNPGDLHAIAAAGVGADVHFVGITTINTATSEGQLWHTIRGAGGNWDPWGDVQNQTGNPEARKGNVACAGIGGDLHVAFTGYSGLWHTIRNEAGLWTQFGDVSGQAGNRGPYADVACAAIGNELHLAAVARDGHLWHTVRSEDGSWSEFGDVEGQTGELGNFLRVACAHVNGELHLVATSTISPALWHAIRHADGTWTPFGNVAAAASDPGQVADVGCAGIGAELHLACAAGPPIIG